MLPIRFTDLQRTASLSQKIREHNLLNQETPGKGWIGTGSDLDWYPHKVSHTHGIGLLKGIELLLICAIWYKNQQFCQRNGSSRSFLEFFWGLEQSPWCSSEPETFLQVLKILNLETECIKPCRHVLGWNFEADAGGDKYWNNFCNFSHSGSLPIFHKLPNSTISGFEQAWTLPFDLTEVFIKRGLFPKWQTPPRPPSFWVITC